jgi:hypothetical protein
MNFFICLPLVLKVKTLTDQAKKRNADPGRIEHGAKGFYTRLGRGKLFTVPGATQGVLLTMN